MGEKDRHKVPEISIDEALKLYISMAFPQGLPEGEEGEKILGAIRKKIVADRPEWAKASGLTGDEDQAGDEPRSYSEIKQKAVEESAREILPEDPEERYLYLRKKEALENSEQKRREQEEALAEDLSRKKVVDRKNEEDQELIQRARLIKKIILERANQKLTPKFEERKVVKSPKPTISFSGQVKNSGDEIKHQVLTFQDQEIDPEAYSNDGDSPEFSKKKQALDAQEWFKDFKSLSIDDRIRSLQDFNERKREMLQTKEDLMYTEHRPSAGSGDMKLEDDDFNMGYGLGFKKDEDSDTHLKLE